MIFSHKLVLKLFEAFSIQRWNDMIRPFDIVEMDKTAEKTFLAFIIGKHEEKKGNQVDWEKIIYCIIFELFRKISLCDIKSPVQKIIRENHPQEYKKLNEWIFEKYDDLIPSKEFKEKFKDYLFDTKQNLELSERILQAAHKYSTLREFEMLIPVNESFRTEKINFLLRQDLDEFSDLKAIQLLLDRLPPHKFVTEIEKLRFQTRWNQTPRVPATSVLGHSFFVAALTFFLSYDLKLNKDRCYNNFFCALFHDLPEAVTRDIISPVKQATDNLPDVVKKIERKIVEQDLLPLADEYYRDEIRFYIEDEFENRAIVNGKTIKVRFEDLSEKYNSKEFKPTDGKLVRFADNISAFVEADSSIRHGITSIHLENGKKNILCNYPVGTKVNSFNTDVFFNAYR